MLREIQNGKNISMSRCVRVCRFWYFESILALWWPVFTVIFVG